MTRLLAVDLDGTLCRRDGSVHEHDRAALRAVAARGVTVALVTGRLRSGTLPLAQELGLGGLHACADGAVIFESPSGKIRNHATLPRAHRGRLRDLLATVGGPTFLLTDSAVLHDDPGRAYLSYMSSWSPEMHAIEDVLADPIWEAEGPTTTVTVGPREDLDEVIAALRAETRLELLCFDASAHPGTAVLVIHPPGESKGSGIARLASHVGCTVDDVVAVGDWLNDIPMFRVAGRSFAVPGCPDSVAREATDLLEATGGEGAVAEAIRRTWG